MADLHELLRITGWDNGSGFYKKTNLEDGYLSVKHMTECFLEDNNMRIQIQREFEETTHVLKAEVEELRKQIELVKEDINLGLGFEQVKDADAQETIENYLIDLKKYNKEKVNILELVEKTNLPPEQIEKLMRELSKKGVREIDD